MGNKYYGKVFSVEGEMVRWGKMDDTRGLFLLHVSNFDRVPKTGDKIEFENEDGTDFVLGYEVKLATVMQ